MYKDFLDYLDLKQQNYIEANNIKNKNFIDYTRLKSDDLTCDKEFYIAKAQKSRILIKHMDIWVDLTDIDLIYIISNMQSDMVKILLGELKEGYEGKWSNFNFSIGEENFQGNGINCDRFELDETVYLEADFEVKISEVLFVLNMVLNKDIVGQKYFKKKLPNKLIETTIMKYISLILHYKFKCKQALCYLQNINYLIYNIDELLEKKMKIRKEDKKFVKNGFDKLLPMLRNILECVMTRSYISKR